MRQARKRKILWISIAVIAIAILILLWPIRTGEIWIGKKGVQKGVVGQEIIIPIDMTSNKLFINATEAYLIFDNSYLEILSIDLGQSAFSHWIFDPEFSNERGSISFAGGLPDPGFKGTVNICTVKAKAKKSGSTALKFSPETKSYMNNGKGTSVNLKLNDIKVDIK